MFYQPDTFFYFLLLPGFFLVVLPALWAVFAMIYRRTSRCRIDRLSSYVEQDDTSSATGANNERRKEKRISIEGPKAIVAKESTCFHTTVTNISGGGICLSHLPEKFFKDSKKSFQVIFRSQDRDYEMNVAQKWGEFCDYGYMVGAEIVSTPAEWRGFVKNLS